MTDLPPHLPPPIHPSLPSRKARHSREGPYREEVFTFRNSLGLALKAYLLSKPFDSPLSSPHRPTHPAASTLSTPSTSPLSHPPTPQSFSPSTPSVLQSSSPFDPASSAPAPPSFPTFPSAPPSPSSSFPPPLPRALIVCHGMAVSSQWGFLPDLTDSLLKEVPGVSAVLRFEFTGCGSSEGDFEYGGYARQVSDISSAVATLRTRGYAVWALIGHSMGANSVLLYASEHHDIPHVVSLSARYRMTRGLPFGAEQLAALQSQGWFTWRPKSASMDEVRVTQETMNERLTLDMDVTRRITARTLTVHGTGDSVIPVADAHSYAELVPQHTLRTIDDADHNYSTEGARLMMITTVVEWLSKGGRESVGSSPALTPASPARGTSGQGVGALGGGGMNGVGAHPTS